MIANYFSGLMVYFTRPFVVGDWIHLPEKNIEGWVEEIGWYMTRVRTFEKRPIYVPNAIFSKIVVVTPSRMSHREFKEVIGLRYSDMPVLKSVIFDLEAMLEEHPHVDQEQKVQVCLKELATYSLDIEVRAYTTITTSEEYAYFKQDMLFRILDVIKAQGAELAAPITTLSIPEGIPCINRASK
jgi:MscS family membrane protein